MCPQMLTQAGSEVYEPKVLSPEVSHPGDGETCLMGSFLSRLEEVLNVPSSIDKITWIWIGLV